MGLREIFEQFADSTGVHGLKVRKSQTIFSCLHFYQKLNAKASKMDQMDYFNNLGVFDVKKCLYYFYFTYFRAEIDKFKARKIYFEIF